MEFFLIIGGIWLVSALLGYSKDKNSSNTNTSSNPSYPPRSRSSSSTSSSTKTNPQTFRPSAKTSSSNKISFKTSSSSSSSNTAVPSDNDLKGLHDAFTGAPLDKALGLYQCQSCKVYYHKESLLVLQEVNSSQCVSCQSTNILEVTLSSKKPQGRDYAPDVITLSNYKQHVGRVVTFEGVVQNVRESRRGNDFAVMFENKSWVQGFKLVFFRGSVRKVGGKPYIMGLNQKKVRVRGLLIKHERFGYEIIVSEKSMIQSTGQ